MTAVVSCGLIQSAHAFYYAFSTLTWKEQGIAPSMTGLLWATGVAGGDRLHVERWSRGADGPGRGTCCCWAGSPRWCRWTALALSPPLWALFPLQTLHALSYAATFLASLQLAERLSTPRNASAAQAMNSALSGGVLSGLATMASGPLFDRYGSSGYLLMSIMCVIGLAGAMRLYGLRRLDPA